MKTIFKTTVTVQHIRLRVHIRFFRQTWANAKKNFTLKSKVSKLTYCLKEERRYGAIVKRKLCQDNSEENSTLPFPAIPLSVTLKGE